MKFRRMSYHINHLKSEGLTDEEIINEISVHWEIQDKITIINCMKYAETLLKERNDDNE